MDSNFHEKYKHYETFPIENLKLIPEVSFYCNNYYVGHDGELIYAETDEFSEITEYYHVKGSSVQHIGFAYVSDKYITIQEEELS